MKKGPSMLLEKYSLGIGDRFGQQGAAQLTALVEAERRGVVVIPVWNKSNREHGLIGTSPESARREADNAVRDLNWRRPYHVDADHIGLSSVDCFLDACDFFTIDVADFIGIPPAPDEIDAFVARHRSQVGVTVADDERLACIVHEDELRRVAGKFLRAVQEASRIYWRIEAAKGRGRFIAEVSMDETDVPQTPTELLIILRALADEGVAVQTIAPKFSGRFNKGVDYQGDLARFEAELNDDLAVVAYAVRNFGLPPNLKLSVHSGSDKFSLYPIIHRALRKTGAGLHLKTAGTTWLEEVSGLAAADGDAWVLVKELYMAAFRRIDELTAPYATVVDIDRHGLPDPQDVETWSGERFASALRHDPTCPAFNPHLRQLIHVSFKIAADMGPRYIEALKANSKSIASGVAQNLLERHIIPVFAGAR